ncbi:restriction endonuclease subunit S [Laribacter hongkongensis]|uniref:restriction endonuclease subunit S n=1 Tax=Laribacter hongkongensis TaxID=168471 RepID=UPI001EFD0B25|nr:restriction endonuclease subunit S [Laribacter hongkongensis]MCG9081276.1 restriction endonuclease subunit S [Laribacter hongkongensis]
MGVRAGYKQTEVGVIPADWSVMPFGQLFAFTNGVNADKTAYGKGFRFINVLEPISYSHIYGPEIPGRVQVSGAVALAYSVKPGDIVFNRTSETDSELGLAAVYLGDEQVVFGGFVIRGRPVDDDLDPRYAGYALRSEVIRSQIIPMGQGAVRANIGQQNLRQVLAVVPPKSEQRAIATALSDADALLDGLTRLIAKKRDLKHATMQQLLTGHTRLPGFSGEWKVNRLGDTAVLKARIGWQGLTTAEYLEAGDFYLVTGTDFQDGYIDWKHCHFVDECRYKQDKYIQLRPHDILVTKDGTIGKVALVPYLPGSATLNSGVFVIRPLADAFDPEFFYYLLCSRAFKDFLDQLCAGSTISHLYQKDFVSFIYRTPPTLEEQTAIAAALSDMDAELAALEARFTKTRALKQAMMSELLTGKTRLRT